MSFKIGDNVKYIGSLNNELDYATNYKIKSSLVSNGKLMISLAGIGDSIKFDSELFVSHNDININIKDIRENFLKNNNNNKVKNLEIKKLREKFSKDKPFDFKKL